MLARMAASTTALVAICLMLFVLTRPEAGLAKPLEVDSKESEMTQLNAHEQEASSLEASASSRQK